MISIIIPLYNREHLIVYTLQSLSAENHPGVDLEVIVVDDQSIDDGLRIVKADFPWVQIIENDLNKGASSCRNQGLRIAKGDYIFFLDSDDIVEPGFFLAKFALLEKEPGLIGAYGPWSHFESEQTYHKEDLRPRKTEYPIYSSPSNQLILNNLLVGWYVPINATLWRREPVMRVGGFSEQLLINQDVDFFFRMLHEGNIAGIQSPIALIRIHQGERVGQAMSKNKLSQILELRKVFLKYLVRLKTDTNENREALALYCFNMWVMYRKIYPDVADDFMRFSKDTYPGLSLKGSLMLRFLSLLIGKENAIVFKQWVS